MKKPGFMLLIVVGLVIVWHVALDLPLDRERCVDAQGNVTAITSSCQMQLTVTVNPLTNVATATIAGPEAWGIADPAMAKGFRWGAGLVGSYTGEKELNDYAHQYFDLYAMILPYRVIIVDKNLPGDKPASLNDSTSIETNSSHSPVISSSPVVAGDPRRLDHGHALDVSAREPAQQAASEKQGSSTAAQLLSDTRPSPPLRDLPDPAEIKRMKQRLFGDRVAEVDEYTESAKSSGRLAVIEFCKPHFCADQGGMLTVDVSTDQASKGRAAGVLYDENEVVVYLGDYGYKESLPSEFRTWMENENWAERRAGRYKNVRYVQPQ